MTESNGEADHDNEEDIHDTPSAIPHGDVTPEDDYSAPCTKKYECAALKENIQMEEVICKSSIV